MDVGSGLVEAEVGGEVDVNNVLREAEAGVEEGAEDVATGVEVMLELEVVPVAC